MFLVFLAAFTKNVMRYFFSRQYEDELIDRIVIPHMINIANDHDIDVRSAVAKLLVDICMDCESKKCLEVLDILEKVLLIAYLNKNEF